MGQAWLRRAAGCGSLSTAKPLTSSLPTPFTAFCVPTQNDLFVVGDPDQSIYEWRGAKLTNMTHQLPADYKCMQVGLQSMRPGAWALSASAWKLPSVTAWTAGGAKGASRLDGCLAWHARVNLFIPLCPADVFPERQLPLHRHHRGLHPASDSL